MYIERIASKQKGKTYHQVLLRKSVRDKKTGKVRKITLANMTKEDGLQVSLIEEILKKQRKSSETPTYFDTLHQGREAGNIIALNHIMDKIGINKTISKYHYSDQIRTLVLARICCQSSRLQAFDRQKNTIIPEYLDTDVGSLQSLYRSLDELAENKNTIEDDLFGEYKKQKQTTANLYLYDVTSSYVEGEYKQSELIQSGYNRDKKKGKQQIVFGLLTNAEGYALSGKVFSGNTNDTKTFDTQINTLKKRFGLEKVTLVGDGGMIKSAGIESLQKYGYSYITSIGDAQIKKLIKKGTLDQTLFDDTLHETIDKENNIRYITRRNPYMAEEIRKTRADAINHFITRSQEQVGILNSKKRAKKEVVERRLKDYIRRYHLDAFLSFAIEGDTLNYVVVVAIDEANKRETELLDGCYCITTDIPQFEKDKEEIHADYKKLINVENAFRTMKTELLEVRPLYLHLDKRIKGHLVVTMLAYNVVRYLEKYCKKIGETRDNVLRLLSHYTTVYIKIGDKKIESFPTPCDTVSSLFKAIGCSITRKILRTCIQ